MAWKVIFRIAWGQGAGGLHPVVKKEQFMKLIAQTGCNQLPNQVLMDTSWMRYLKARLSRMAPKAYMILEGYSHIAGVGRNDGTPFASRILLNGIRRHHCAHGAGLI
ncbi:MAG: hypothetical protein QNJ02_07370 [Desulfobacterales bacterium]|nr:hypothetical protein [Desulfobacterales bacterium]